MPRPKEFGVAQPAPDCYRREMSSSVARCLAGAVVAAWLGLAAGSALARGRHHKFFRLELSTGKVEQLSDLPARKPVAPWPAPAADPRRSITSDVRTLVVLEATAGRRLWEFTVPGSGDGWIPWRVLQGNTVTYAWREQTPGQRNQYRDIVRAIDMTTRKVLWERIGPYHDPPGAIAVGAAHIAVDQDSEVVFLETRTGRAVHRIAKTDETEESFAVASARPGRVWVAAGDAIECIDDRTMKVIWRAPKRGALLSLQPIPGGDDWLAKTASHTLRLRAGDGRVLWSSPSPSTSRPLISGGRIYEATLAKTSARRGELSVVVRDLGTGAAVREHVLDRYEHFFDEVTAVAVDARNGKVDVAAEFIVLD
jgi:hypothetical protein